MVTIRLIISKAMEELRLNQDLIRIPCGGILPVDYPFHQDQDVAQEVNSETPTETARLYAAKQAMKRQM
jgi:hypothetical protein